MKERADATESAGFQYGVGEGRYDCTVKALHYDLGEQMAANADPAFSLQRTITEQLTQQALMKKETDFSEAFLDCWRLGHYYCFNRHCQVER